MSSEVLEGTLDQVLAEIRRRFPSSNISGWRHPYDSFQVWVGQTMVARVVGDVDGGRWRLTC